MNKMIQSDDDISEFAEFVWLRCAESKETLIPYDQAGLNAVCPLHVAFGTDEPECLSHAEASGFMNGFDGAPVRGFDRRLHALGRRFREQALSGEGFR